MQKSTQHKYIAISLLAVLCFSFYWSQIRPTRIRSACSWTQRHSDAIPEKLPPSTENLNKYENCLNNTKPDTWDRLTCIKPPEASPSQPAKDWWNHSTDKEYQTCLRDRGFKN